jgi:hypothetical protein
MMVVHGGLDQKRGLMLAAQRDPDEGHHLIGQRRLVGRDADRIGDGATNPADDRGVQRRLAAEVIVDGRPGQADLDGDRLERRGLVTELGEYLARRLQDSFAGQRRTPPAACRSPPPRPARRSTTPARPA